MLIYIVLLMNYLMVVYVNIYCIIDKLMYSELFDVVSRWYDYYYWVVWWWFMLIYIVLLIDIIDKLLKVIYVQVYGINNWYYWWIM